MIFDDIFSQVTPLSKSFQMLGANLLSTMKHNTFLMGKKRSEDFFTKIWATASAMAIKLGTPLSLPVKRQKAMPSHFSQFFVQSTVGVRDFQTEVQDNEDILRFYRN